jgi:hypothetical protein
MSDSIPSCGGQSLDPCAFGSGFVTGLVFAIPFALPMGIGFKLGMILFSALLDKCPDWVVGIGVKLLELPAIIIGGVMMLTLFSVASMTDFDSAGASSPSKVTPDMWGARGVVVGCCIAYALLWTAHRRGVPLTPRAWEEAYRRRRWQATMREMEADKGRGASER